LVNCHKRAHCDTTQNSIGLKPKNTRSNNFSQKPSIFNSDNNYWVESIPMTLAPGREIQNSSTL